MRGRVHPPSDSDSEPKRARRDSDETGKERGKPVLQEQVQAFLTLVEDRRSEVRRIELQLNEAKKKLLDAEAQLGRAQSHLQPRMSAEAPLSSADSAKVKIEQDEEFLSRERSENGIAPLSKPPLVIPGSNGYSRQNTKVGPNLKMAENPKKIAGSRSSSTSEVDAAERSKARKFAVNKMTAVKVETSGLSEKRPKKRRPEAKDHVELISHIRESSTPCLLRMLQPNYVTSQHKRRLRSLCVNPSSDQICATSALDGIVNLWEIQSKGVGLSLLSSVDCHSPGERRWPEDMTWHPSGEYLFACYSADGNDNQVALIGSSGKKPSFLEDKPHVKGILNSIIFMPWYEETLFATGGSDHAVVMWGEKEGLGWKPKALHRKLHSSAVMGVAGLQHKQTVLSVGADKRVIGFDTRYQKADFQFQLESKAMGVLPNPVDFNLFMVQIGTPGQQLRLFDIRVQRSELHVFGWNQETSDSQSALINQMWSPDGHYIVSGSADPKIHLFDIRYNSNMPSQSIKAHQKRVFKASWHHSLPLLISISSDLSIGLHRSFS